jgi:hypothetical protein
MVQSQPGKMVCETLSRKNPSQKRAGGVAQGEGPEFKLQYHNNNNIQNMQSTRKLNKKRTNNPINK